MADPRLRAWQSVRWMLAVYRHAESGYRFAFRTHQFADPAALVEERHLLYLRPWVGRVEIIEVRSTAVERTVRMRELMRSTTLRRPPLLPEGADSVERRYGVEGFGPATLPTPGALRAELERLRRLRKHHLHLSPRIPDSERVRLLEVTLARFVRRVSVTSLAEHA